MIFLEKNITLWEHHIFLLKLPRALSQLTINKDERCNARYKDDGKAILFTHKFNMKIDSSSISGFTIIV